MIRRDPALSVEEPRAGNNSFFGSGGGTEAVDEAVYRLGFYQVYQLTVSGSFLGWNVMTWTVGNIWCAAR